MKAILFGVLLAMVLLWTPALSLTADTLSALTQPAVLAFGLGVLSRPAIARRVRRWAR
ncbi:hypothetical protein SAMN05216532_3996 [Streptomyces sp. 2231.1]|uniref:hypothetical protein n=1 Tax=Streptomyces sp. 2231.1 TaxID=1855347 RepID=UPI00089C80CF|nr:hypothetical protein [Streptomyces sp. 2231.1]SED26480.1 hypothetical protein SAMN05216532_3996 [Streptomyces sp. 2231.1]